MRARSQARVFEGDILCNDTYQKQIKPNSIDAIITQPPCEHKKFDCWLALWNFADYALKDDGFLFAVGWTKYTARTVLAHLDGRYKAKWVMGYSLFYKEPIATEEEAGRQVCAKPVYVWAKPEFQEPFGKHNMPFAAEQEALDGLKHGYSFSWYAEYEKTHKASHPDHWLNGVVDTLTMPFALVCDPFASDGSTGVACKALGRRFIGFDMDGEKVKKAQHALAVTDQNRA